MKHKKIPALLVTAFTAFRLFAQDLMPAGMTSLAESILEIFTGDFVKIILAIFLCGSAIAYGFNKDNEKIKRNAIAIGVAAAILIAASSIVNAVWDASGG
ncbi:MAG: TrbC/VirB2 family protein [Treponema sp.]|jgi:type IV secretory pathway VirB2 component (pilin)|nr:TrbC/VirB2 family protein [Treponema sp.]